MSINKTLNIGLVCIGSEICIPIDGVKNNSGVSATNVTVTAQIPAGLQFVRANLPKGTYDTITKVWSVGTLAPAEEVNAELCFLILDDSSPVFKFTFTVGSTDSCEGCLADNSYCVTTTGITCTQLRLCEPGIAVNDVFSVGKNGSASGLDVSDNDDPCPSAIATTYDWIDITNAKGTITGVPTNFTYEPDLNFCGIGFAEYGLYCNGILYDKATVQFDVTCSAPLDDSFAIELNGTYTENVSTNDLDCLFGLITTYHLVSDPTADGIGLSEPTTDASVVVTEWDQTTGDFEISGTNAVYSTFDYFHRCTDAEGNILFESAPATVYLPVNSPTPTPTPTVTPTPTPTTP